MTDYLFCHTNEFEIVFCYLIKKEPLFLLMIDNS